MKGKVNSGREAVVRIRVLGKKKTGQFINAVIDTGYTGSLSLPSSMIKSLGMRLLGRRFAELADGRVVTFSYYSGSVHWHGRPFAVEIDESPSDPLIGMKLLEGSDLSIRIKRGGAVSIQAIR